MVRVLLLLCVCAPAGWSVQPELVIHKEGTTLYHRPACEAVRDGKGVLALTRGQAEARGLKPHAACDPATIGKNGTEGRPSGGPRDETPTFVQVDESKYYHRSTCSKLQKDSKRVELESAGKTHWPCPRCRPPVRKRSAEPAIPKQAARD